MKKIYARQIAPEYQESPLCWGEWPENVVLYAFDGWTRTEKYTEV